MIKKLSSRFNLNMASSRWVYIFTAYALYILIFYIILPLIIFALQDFNFGGIPFLFLIFLVAPVLSYAIPNSLIGFYPKLRMYILHTIFVLLLPFFYLYLILINSNLPFGGF